MRALRVSPARETAGAGFSGRLRTAHRCGAPTRSSICRPPTARWPGSAPGLTPNWLARHRRAPNSQLGGQAWPQAARERPPWQSSTVNAGSVSVGWRRRPGRTRGSGRRHPIQAGPATRLLATTGDESGQVRPGQLSQLWCPLRYVGRGDHGDDLELDEITPARGPLMECVTDVDRVALRVLAAACHDGEMQEIGIRAT